MKPTEGWIAAFKHRYTPTDKGFVIPRPNKDKRLAEVLIGYNHRGKEYRVTVDHLGERHTFSGATLAWIWYKGEHPGIRVTTKNGNKRDLREDNLIIYGDSDV